MALPGTTAAQFLKMLVSGRFDRMIKEAPFIFVSYGSNDALQTLAASAFAASITGIIDYCIGVKNRAQVVGEYVVPVSQTTIILKTPPPTSVAAVSANLAAFPAYLATVPALYTGTVNILVSARYTLIATPIAANDNNFTETALGSQLHLRWAYTKDTLYNDLYPKLKAGVAYYSITGHY